MKTKWTPERIGAELKEIQDRIPKTLLKNVITEVPANPAILMVVNKALEDPDFPEEKKKKLQILKDAGEFDKKQYKQNNKIAKMIDQFVEREIAKKIKAGKLPKRSEIKNLPHVKELYEKVHNPEN